MKPVIEVKDLVKVYGKRRTAFTALKKINLEIMKGESVAIVGKSGSGKSTLMHLIALLDRPTEGTIKIDGIDSTKLGNRKLNQLRNSSFGFVFQQFFMNPQDSVLENVILPLKIAGKKRKERRELALKALKTVGLADRAKFKANALSGGQKQRVCIARAIVNNPKILFADEPTGNLDSVTGEKVIKLLFDFNKKKGATLIIVTHDDDLAALCDRQIRISDGKMIEDSQEKAAEKKTKDEKIKSTKTRKSKSQVASTKSPKNAKTPTTSAKSHSVVAKSKVANSKTTKTKNAKGVA